MRIWNCVKGWVWLWLRCVWSSAYDSRSRSSWSMYVRCHHCTSQFTESHMHWCWSWWAVVNETSTTLCTTLQAAVGPRCCHGDSTGWCGSGCLCEKCTWSCSGKGEEITTSEPALVWHEHCYIKLLLSLLRQWSHVDIVVVIIIIITPKSAGYT